MLKNRIACIQMTSGTDVAENMRQAQKLIADAVSQGAKLIILPEMFCLMGMDQMDKVTHKEKLGKGPIQDFLQQQALTQGIWLVAGTIPITAPEHPEKVYAACLLYNDQGECEAGYYKNHLFDVYVNQSKETYLESAIVEPGHEVVVVATPFGKIGLSVCYDIRFPELFRQMLAKGVEVIVLPAAFTYTTGAAHWEILTRARAIENQVYLLAACQSGVHANGRKTYGHSMIVNPWGDVQASLVEGTGVVIGDIDLSKLQQLRKEFPVLSHRRLD